MKLSDRLKTIRGTTDPIQPTAQGAPDPLGPADGVAPSHHTAGSDEAALPSAASPLQPTDPGPGSPASPASAFSAQESASVSPVEPRASGPRAPDALSGLKARVAETLFQRLGSRMSDPSLSEDALRALARDELSRAIDAEQVPLTPEERRRLIRTVGDEVLGLGPLQALLDDPTVTEIMVNHHEQIFVERHGRLSAVNESFSTDDHLRRVIERIVSRVGRRIDESSPLVDARLEDGSRVNAIIPPLAVNGPSLTIRKFGAVPLTVSDLIGYGTVSPEIADLLRACVQARLNIVISGGTGTGKTTLLNVMSSFIPNDERIVTIEDAVELQLQQDHVVRLESRPPNIEGSGAVTIRDLVRNSLRMRPDRIVVGEVRGGESLDMLQAMNTGHDGSISTVHANAPRDAIARLETLVLMAGMDLPLRAIREQIASAVDVVVHLARLRDGSRRVTHVTEVQGMEGDVVTLQDAFVFDFSAGVDQQGRFLGRPISTGVRPRFVEHFKDVGVRLPMGLFEAGPR
ncbi:ATPase, T2SS/T4P/T4SS family [Zhihengliuella flava]|uniref:Pilus assembly protein CpaF n=1 Tax=Zhihengliuella flava TaxID=1285193 RepID=A0A931GFM7_9MICC|nr:ATPase, T2SS/T4P/T4SS family [Zhihengliuella flava]MBG6085415.1 pilus assembly protein CpaF [Zhihengliuella flava]